MVAIKAAIRPCAMSSSQTSPATRASADRKLANREMVSHQVDVKQSGHGRNMQGQLDDSIEWELLTTA